MSSWVCSSPCMLNRRLRGRNLYRAIIILPWAIPAVASLQIWRTEYNYQYGAVNQILNLVGLPPVQWMSDPIWNFVAMIITNVWLGVPFMMVITLGALQSISQDYYEAAELDGASGRQQFRASRYRSSSRSWSRRSCWACSSRSTTSWCPFFINEQYLTTSDILVTALYRAAFQYSRYGYRGRVRVRRSSRSCWCSPSSTCARPTS